MNQNKTTLLSQYIQKETQDRKPFNTGNHSCVAIVIRPDYSFD